MDYVIVDNRDTLIKSDASLSYYKNDIEFFFSSPAFYNPEAVSFKYRLAGSDNSWQVTKSNERMLRFSSLEPGRYTFEAVAVNKDGLQQSGAISFSFVILKPWWSNIWFIIFINVVIVAIAYVSIRNKMNRRLKVEGMRRSIASDLHDDIGATLSSINIYTELVKDEVGENEYLEQIERTITDTVSRLDDLVWSINPKNDTMEQLMNRMQHTAVPLLQAAGIECHFSCDESFLDLKLNLTDKRNVYLLFKETVNNVIKHSRCHHCYINISCNHPYLTLSVSDDGIGFNPILADKSRNGLQNMRYRAGQMNGTVQINSFHNRGSVIVVQLKA